MPAGLLDRLGKPAEPGAATASASIAAGKPTKRGMFQELMNFSYQRTPLQAVGWYLMYLLIGLIIGAVAGRVAGLGGSTPDEAFNLGNIAGQLSAIPYHILLGTLLLWHRRRDAPSILLMLAGVVLSMLLGSLGGLIPLAVLTCRPVMKP
jgi:hypothetical protein